MPYDTTLPCRSAGVHRSLTYLPYPPHCCAVPVDDQLGNGQLTDWEALIDPLLTPSGKKSGKKALNMTRKKRSVC